MDQGITPAAMRVRVNELAPLLHTYVVPSQLDFVATRAKARGDQTAGGFAIAAAKFLNVIPVVLAKKGETGPCAKLRGVDNAREHVLKLTLRELQRKNIKSSFISASFSGDMGKVLALSAWRQLSMACAASGIGLSLKDMSPTNSINVGPDALSLGFAAGPHSADL